MHNVSVRDGWESLSNGFDVEFRRSIPVRISDNGHGMTVPEDVLLEEVSALGKLHVCLGDWESGERAGEHEVSLYVSGREFAEVLRRLAVSSAALFVERYHKSVDGSTSTGTGWNTFGISERHLISAGLPGVTSTWMPTSMTMLKSCIARPAGWHSLANVRWSNRSDAFYPRW